jgi:WD40 repeat protein
MKNVDFRSSSPRPYGSACASVKITKHEKARSEPPRPIVQLKSTSTLYALIRRYTFVARAALPCENEAILARELTVFQLMFSALKNNIGARAVFLISIVFALSVLVPQVSSKLSVRSELVQLQDRNGLRLVAVRDNKIFTVSYASRTLIQSKRFIEKGSVETGTVSPDGATVAISLCLDPGFTHPTPNWTDCPAGFVFATVRPDGSDLKEYRDYANPAPSFCWSHDMSKIVLNMQARRQARYAPYNLEIVNLETGSTEIVDESRYVFVDPQCWSPDDKRLVYTVNKESAIRIVRLYDTDTKKSRDIASGGHSTWSPDGKWIAFIECPPTLRGCKYYGIETSTNEQKLLFKKDAETGLSWTPDSRFVAYVDGASALERTPSEQLREMLRLRVRRLDDGAEVPVADFFDGDFMWFNWVSLPSKASVPD